MVLLDGLVIIIVHNIMSDEVTNTLKGAAAAFSTPSIEKITINGVEANCRVNIGSTFVINITGGVPNTKFTINAFIKPEGHTGTSTWEGTIGSDGTYTSSPVTLPAVGYYQLKFSFSGSGNSADYRVSMIQTGYTEVATAPTSVSVNTSFEIKITGGVPNSQGWWQYNNPVSNVVETVNYQFTLNSSGEVTLTNPGYPSGLPANGTYPIKLEFYATLNRINLTLTATGGSNEPTPTPTPGDNSGGNSPTGTPTPTQDIKTITGRNGNLTPTTNFLTLIDGTEKFYQSSILKFSFMAKGPFFAQNASSGKYGLVGIVSRCNTSKAPSEILGVGIVMGNVTNQPNQLNNHYVPNPLFPSIQAVTWLGAKASPTQYGLTTRTTLPLTGAGTPPILTDDTKYDIVITSTVSADKTNQVLRFTISSAGSLIYDSGSIADPNRSYDPSFNGLIVSTDSLNSSSTGWTLEFTSVELTLSSPITTGSSGNPSTGGRGGTNTATGNESGLMAVIQSYIDQANAEIEAIYNANKSSLEIMKVAYNYAGAQLARELRARYIGIPAVPSPVRDSNLNRSPTSYIMFVDTIPELAQDTRPHMYAQTLEAISDLNTVGGQSVIGLLRESRNQTRLNILGTTLDNNISGNLTTKEVNTLITNGTIDNSPNGINNYTAPAILINDSSGNTLVPIPTGTYNPDTGIFRSTGNHSVPFEYSPLGNIVPGFPGGGNVGNIIITTGNATPGGNIIISTGPIIVNGDGTEIDTGDSNVGTLGGSKYRNVLSSTLNIDYISSTVIASKYSVAEAIEQVIHCNCECWLG